MSEFKIERTWDVRTVSLVLSVNRELTPTEYKGLRKELHEIQWVIDYDVSDFATWYVTIKVHGLEQLEDSMAFLLDAIEKAVRGVS